MLGHVPGVPKVRRVDRFRIVPRVPSAPSVPCVPRVHGAPAVSRLPMVPRVPRAPRGPMVCRFRRVLGCRKVRMFRKSRQRAVCLYAPRAPSRYILPGRLSKSNLPMVRLSPTISAWARVRDVLSPGPYSSPGCAIPRRLRGRLPYRDTTKPKGVASTRGVPMSP